MVHRLRSCYRRSNRDSAVTLVKNLWARRPGSCPGHSRVLRRSFFVACQHTHSHLSPYFVSEARKVSRRVSAVALACIVYSLLLPQPVPQPCPFTFPAARRVRSAASRLTAAARRKPNATTAAWKIRCWCPARRPKVPRRRAAPRSIPLPLHRTSPRQQWVAAMAL